MSTLAYNKQI